jgi:hypothetical protein
MKPKNRRDDTIVPADKETLRTRLALESALDVLGEEPKRLILRYLEHQYGIMLDGQRGHAPPASEIKNGLRAILGQGADLLIPVFEKNRANSAGHAQAG